MVTHGPQGGFVTVEYVAATGLSLLLLVSLLNLVAYQYGRGVVRAALDEGVRAASRAGAGPADCQARADDALGDLLGGAMGAHVAITCAGSGGQATATADVTFTGWLPIIPDWTFTAAATAVQERAP